MDQTLEMTLQPPLRQAHSSDWKMVADITAAAFAEDPVMSWVMGSPRAIRSALRVFAREIYCRAGLCHLHGDQGATMWMPSDAAAAPGRLAMATFALGQLVHGSTRSLKRAEEAQASMAKHHPKEPHLYLFTIGAQPAARGQGIGKALLAPVLAACDHAGMPVYLENSNPVNHGFYVAHGFERRGTFPVGEGGPPMAPMWRTPHVAEPGGIR